MIASLVDLIKGVGDLNQERYARAIDNLVELDTEKNLNPLGELQDPFTVLVQLINTLKRFRMTPEKHNILPIYGCQCNLSDRTIKVSGCIDMRQTSPNSYAMDGLNCEACGCSNNTKVEFLPQEFYVRISDCERDYGDTGKTEAPYFKDYYINGVIQYNEAAKHFRYVQIRYVKGRIMPNFNATDRT